VKLLLAVQIMWGYMLTLSTFILTFFLKECYDYWVVTNLNPSTPQPSTLNPSTLNPSTLNPQTSTL
jgi:hypothetical protein